MKFITRDELLKVYEVHEGKIRKMSKAIIVISFIIIISITPQFFFLEKVLGTLYLPVMLLLGIVELALVFLLPYIAYFFAFRKIEGGMNSIRIIRFARKHKKLHFLRSTEIASDRYLNYVKSCINAEKNEFNHFTLVCSELYAYIARTEPELAYQALQELERTFNPKVHYQIDFVYAKLSYAMQFCAYDDFKRLCDDNPALYQDSSKRYESLLGYASNNVHELRENRRYQEAIEQLDIILEFSKKDLVPVNTLEPAKLNHRVLTYAHLLLDKASLYFESGDRERSLECVNESDVYAQRVTCPLTPLFIKDHKEIMQKLYPLQKDQSAPLD